MFLLHLSCNFFSLSEAMEVLYQSQRMGIVVGKNSNINKKLKNAASLTFSLFMYLAIYLLIVIISFLFFHMVCRSTTIYASHMELKGA